jgi:two-component system, cell cycle response regulator DivK
LFIGSFFIAYVDSFFLLLVTIYLQYWFYIINIGLKKFYSMIKNWENKIVLIAEDEQINYLFLKAVLKPTKAQLIWTKTGRETVQICNSQKVDIVLMDIKMPDLNGLEATMEIKKINPRIPVIAQTAYVMEEDEEASIKAGCDDYISKPIRPENLLTIMSKFLDS